LEIRYKRFDHLDGPTIAAPAAGVLSIKYENGAVQIINAFPAGNQTAGAFAGQASAPISDVPAALQTILNSLPAVPIAGNNLKFIFNNDKWTATVNGENFLAGAIELESTADGAMLTLKQTHI
jgi:frataxin-like iron-binding protein CyaY